MYVCRKCNYKTDCSNSFQIHLKCKKHLKNINTDNESNEEIKIYRCKFCFFETNFKNNYHNHLITLYHKKNIK
jgi:hypothetical protein